MGLVVAALLVDGDRVLATRRTAPPSTAGRWEFPGGKVEPGEDEAAALVRECREELGVDVTPGRRLGSAATPSVSLALWSVVAWRGPVRLLADHDALRWLRADELDGPDGPDWLDLDRDQLADVRAHLRESADAASNEQAMTNRP